MKYRKFGFEHLLFFVIISLLLLPYGCNKTEETENKAPTCAITSPANSEEIQKGETVTVSVDADDTDGNVTEVRFYVDGYRVGFSSSLPYNYSWNTSSEITGNHTIKATAKDNGGVSTSDEITVSITDSGSSDNEPVAAFTVSQTSINTVSSLQFTDQSSNNPTSWYWEFGDGGTSISQNPSHTYSNAGNYTVSLTATNSYGSNTETKTNYIIVTISGQTGTVTDYDENTYNTMKIGSQWWMTENLKTTHFSNGTIIQLVESTSNWDDLNYNAKAYCYYNSNEDNEANTYGALYTWSAAMSGAASSNNNPSGVQGICPNGWHLPSDNEWKELEMYLGMSQADADNIGYRGTNEGSKLAGNANLWNGGDLENDVAFGLSGLQALPGGYRGFTGIFFDLGDSGSFWCATEYDNSDPLGRTLYFNYTKVRRYYFDSTYGRSVRCVKDD